MSLARGIEPSAGRIVASTFLLYPARVFGGAAKLLPVGEPVVEQRAERA